MKTWLHGEHREYANTSDIASVVGICKGLVRAIRNGISIPRVEMRLQGWCRMVSTTMKSVQPTVLKQRASRESIAYNGD